jgi:hypothetical protein
MDQGVYDRLLRGWHEHLSGLPEALADEADWRLGVFIDFARPLWEEAGL